ncbi:beta-2 adrenergic receptor-like [Lingula anatina]|uniref:Beta-2 adrenergic receptor-like n=2 Tax=Lingula anatina TaxID=7574 RepID=A0A2R2MMN5_LINAN|nr:beta-2 adrenergic receptor-like [Lingula anatina]|eukprot:XP_023931476.1 beta-2 adrenergic receptor-like [Lingula anatina]
MCSWLVVRGLICTANVISLLNLFGMAIIHFLAIKKPLRYRTSITTTHAKWMLGIFWLFSFLVGYSDLLIGLVDYHVKDDTTDNYCQHTIFNHFHSQQIMFAIAFVCFVVMAYLYGRIFHQMKVHRSFAREDDTLFHSQGHCWPLQHTYRNNRKAIRTTLLIFGTFFVCWMPLTMFELVMLIRAKQGLIDSESVPTLLIAGEYLHDVLLLNSVCDPAIYIMRVRDVRAGFERFKRRCCRCLSHIWWLLVTVGNTRSDPPVALSALNTDRSSSNNLRVPHELIESL